MKMVSFLRVLIVTCSSEVDLQVDIFPSEKRFVIISLTRPG